MKKYTIKAEVNAADDVSIRPYDVTNALEWMGMDKGVSPSGVFCSSMKVSVTDKESDALYALPDASTLSVNEVADRLMNSRLEHGERIGDVRLECGCDLEIDILIDEPSDPRLDGHLDRTETFTISDIREDFTEGDWYAWGEERGRRGCSHLLLKGARHMMNAIAYIVFGYLIVQAVALIALALWSEWRHPTRTTRTTRRTLASPYSIELN